MLALAEIGREAYIKDAMPSVSFTPHTLPSLPSKNGGFWIVGRISFSKKTTSCALCLAFLAQNRVVNHCMEIAFSCSFLKIQRHLRHGVIKKKVHIAMVLFLDATRGI
jgi:hypothetical protein